MSQINVIHEEVETIHHEPLFLPGTKNTAVVLFHGWSSFPRQVKYIAEFLNSLGYWVSVPMLKGHGTVPEDLETATSQDWIAEAEQAVQAMKRNPAIKNVVLGGTSMGGNLALLSSQKIPVGGIFTIGTPVHFRNHFLIWLGTLTPEWIKKYQSKKYPKSVLKQKELLGFTSYRYFPIKSVRECMDVVRQSVFTLRKVTAPLLIFQTHTDYLVARYSPWILYNGVSSRYKKMQWLDSKAGNHILIEPSTPKFFPVLKEFIEAIEQGTLSKP